MKLLDANVLIYAYNADSPHHLPCRHWLESAFNDANEIVALPWQTILAFIRISTNPRAMTRPLASEAACRIVGQWLERPNVQTVEYGERFWALFLEQINVAKVSGPLVTDAALAAVTLEQGATLCTTDGDFRRFPGLKLIDPLQAH
jgi:toxin-antitoxin system PIN domain toxin